jgi:hypothetical protein
MFRHVKHIRWQRWGCIWYLIHIVFPPPPEQDGSYCEKTTPFVGFLEALILAELER